MGCSSNPQIQAGRNGNAIGLYVEGNGTLTAEQRLALSQLENSFLKACRIQGADPGEVVPAGQLEADALNGPRQSMNPAIPARPAQSIRAGMGQ